jgi:hypothetical protein
VRADALGPGGARAAALSTDTAQLYRSLNEADAMASTGLAAGGTEPATVRARYDDHVARAADRLVHAASLVPPGGRDVASIELIAERLADYTAMIEAARAFGGQGSPLAQESLNGASRLMRATILPAADELRRAQASALTANYGRASAFPTAVVLVAVAALAAVLYAGVRELRRTNRILNLGLLAAATALTAALLWWLVATFAANDQLDAARGHNDVATALAEARVAVLSARASETQGVTDGGSEEEFASALQRLLGPGELLDTAAGRATGAAASRVEAIRAAAVDWQEAHRRLRALADAGNLELARASAIGPDPEGSAAAFDRLAAALADAIGAEQTALAIDVRGAGSAFTGIAEGPAVLALLAAAGVVGGIGQRLWEYR